MNYLIDDLKVAELLRQLRSEYTHVRAVSEAQQFLAREGKAQFTPPPKVEPANRAAMLDAMREEALRLDMCHHVWAQQHGHRHKICNLCGSIEYGD